MDDLAWYAANSGGTTHPVWEKKPNAWGLHGLHGNGWEWCADVYHASYTNAPTDGSTWTTGGDGGPIAPGEGRVLRGGAWGLPARVERGEDCRASSRAPYPRGERCNNSGFRLALTLHGPPAPVKPSASPPPEPTRRLHVRDVAFEFLRVPAGDFLMGSEAGGIFPFSHKPVHRVCVGRTFYLGRTEVTVAQFRAFVEGSGYLTEAEKSGWVRGSRGRRFQNASWRTPPEGTASNDSPVVCVSWNDAVALCAWLSRETRQTIRLPAEAEWEYTCRVGCSEEETDRRLDELGWHAANCRAPQPVARKRGNAWGFHDMLGNVAEWCEDVWHDNYAGEGPPPDGTAWLPASAEHLVLRGGHWACSPKVKLLTAYAREPATRDQASTQVGIRLVCAE